MLAWEGPDGGCFINIYQKGLLSYSYTDVYILNRLDCHTCIISFAMGIQANNVCRTAHCMQAGWERSPLLCVITCFTGCKHFHMFPTMDPSDMCTSYVHSSLYVDWCEVTTVICHILGENLLIQDGLFSCASSSCANILMLSWSFLGGRMSVAKSVPAEPFVCKPGRGQQRWRS